MSTDSHPYVWINYYKPQYGQCPTAYKFGDGTEGGYGGIECDSIYAKSTSSIGNLESYYPGYILSVFGSAKASRWDIVSDPDLKENIVKQDGLKALDKISTLKFYSYDLKREIAQGEAAHTDIGLIANEAPKEIQSPDSKGIDLYAYISLTAKAVQELSVKVAQQEKEIAELKATIAELKP